MKKLFLIFLFLSGVVFSQTAWEKQLLEGTVQYSIRLTGLDTTTNNAVKFSDWVDISLLDRSKLISYFIKTAGDDVDTLDGNIETKYHFGSTTVIDTVLSGIVSNGEAGYEDTLNVVTGTWTPIGNEIRLRVNCRDLTSSTSNGTYLLVIRGTLIPASERNLYKP
jgi:hypothetical protein